MCLISSLKYTLKVCTLNLYRIFLHTVMARSLSDVFYQFDYEFVLLVEHSQIHNSLTLGAPTKKFQSITFLD